MQVLESCVPVTRLTLAIRLFACYFVQLRIAKVNLVTGTQDSSTCIGNDAMVGSLAGDDTVFVVMRTPEQAREFTDNFHDTLSTH